MPTWRCGLSAGPSWIAATLILAHHGESYPVDTLMAAWHGAYDAIVEREGLVLKPGLLELLDWLEDNAITKAVATSTRHARARAKLERTALFPRFAALVGGDEVAQGKPSPDIFIAAIARIGCAPADALVLEDSEPGLIAAARAGIPAIAIPDLLPSPELVHGRSAARDANAARSKSASGVARPLRSIRVG